MPYTVEISDNGLYAVATHTGVVTRDELEHARSQVTKQMEAMRCMRLLVDMSAVTEGPTMFQLYRFANENAFALPSWLRMAIVEGPGRQQHGEYVADISKQSGHFMQAFTDRDEAVRWLLSDMVQGN